MLKSLSLTACSIFVLAQTAIAQAELNPIDSATTGPASNGPTSHSITPVDLVCYMQTADGRTIDLGTLCGQPRPLQAAESGATATALSPYTNLGGLDIYGGGRNAAPCFGLDDQGNPCPSSR
jgi:hypothetical protein